MWVEPNGKVIILSGVPVDPTQTDVPWFSSAGAQEGFFKGFTLKSYSKVSFMRVNTSVPQSAQGNTGSPRTASTIRVPTNAAELYTANYLMFQNTSYSSKWFYAFVETVNPLSDNATEITYQIDDIQTWQFDFTVGASPLKREHIKASEDKIGANVVAEPFNFERQPIILKRKISSTVNALLVVTTPDGTKAAENPYSEGGYVTGAEILPFTTQSEMVSKITEYVEKKNISGILTAVSCALAPATPETVELPISSLYFPSTATQSEIYSYSQVKNKKLLTSQFIQAYCETSDGTNKEWKIEAFVDKTKCSFEVSVGGLPWMWSVIPVGFFNVYTRQVERMCGELSADVPFGGSTFATLTGNAWLKALGNVGAGALAGLRGGAKGAAIGAGVAALSEVGSLLSAYTSPTRSRGVAGNPAGLLGSALVNNVAGAYFGYSAITADEAKDIDEFFTYYGYATDGCRVPNGLYSNKRSVFNYVQTDGCIFSACSCPADSASNIKKIFDKGVRLWHDTSKIGTVVTDNT